MSFEFILNGNKLTGNAIDEKNRPADVKGTLIGDEISFIVTPHETKNDLYSLCAPQLFFSLAGHGLPRDFVIHSESCVCVVC